jgi:hypothetical protein
LSYLSKLENLAAMFVLLAKTSTLSYNYCMGKGNGNECGAGMEGMAVLLSSDPLWQNGGCAEYALALVEKYPNLTLGVNGAVDMYDPDWEPWSEEPAPLETVNHVFAHDDTYAYDSLGRHPLPYHTPWDAGFKPEEETNHLHMSRQELINLLESDWGPHPGQDKWLPRQELVEQAALLLGN